VEIFANPSNIVISWPTNAAVFVLQQTTNLSQAATWSPVTNSITVNGTNNTITLATGTGIAQYFELIAAP
jgi:hypothetical protein